MRGKSGLVWVIAGVVLAGGLAINFAMRPDDAELEPTTPAAVRSPRASERREDPEPTSREERAPAEADEPSEPVVAAVEAEPEGPSCEHPFVPSAPGQWRRYAWRQSGEERAAELRIEAVRARELEDGEREITWQVEITATDDRAELASEEMTTRCVPGRSAEEPWFGILERSLALTLTSQPRWRWPARLSAGATFEGTASFDTEGASMRMPDDAPGPQVLRVTRSHVVGEREPITVPAGSWRAWRVDYDERHAFGERGENGSGTTWVASGIGMVMSSAENSQGVSQTIELVAYGPR
jgi:hypothetical protein